MLDYDHKLNGEQLLGEMAGLRRVQRHQRVPVVLSREEVKAIWEQMTGVARLMAELMYDLGLRVNECMTLRVKDIDFSGGMLNVRSGKGGKDRTMALPKRLHAPLKQQLLRVAELHKQDLSHGAGGAPPPSEVARKDPAALASLAWQFVFSSAVLRPWGENGRLARWHVSNSTVRRAFLEARDRAGIQKHASVHSLRHSLATHLWASEFAGNCILRNQRLSQPI